jgi:hypothetical protein
MAKMSGEFFQTFCWVVNWCEQSDWESGFQSDDSKGLFEVGVVSDYGSMFKRSRKGVSYKMYS